MDDRPDSCTATHAPHLNIPPLPIMQAFGEELAALAAQAAALADAGAQPMPAGPLLIDASPLAAALRRESDAWRAAVAAELQAVARVQLDDVKTFVRGVSARLARKVEDLADAHAVAVALREVGGVILARVLVRRTMLITNNIHLPIQNPSFARAKTRRLSTRQQSRPRTSCSTATRPPATGMLRARRRWTKCWVLCTPLKSCARPPGRRATCLGHAG